MKFLKWEEEDPHTLLGLVRKLLRIGSAWAIVACLGTIAFKLLFERPLAPFFHSWVQTLRTAALVGAIFGDSFYLICGYPWRWYGPLLKNFPRSLVRPMVAVIGAVGAAISFTVSVMVIHALLGIEIVSGEHLGHAIAVEAIFGAVLALSIGTFKHLRAEVRLAEARALEKEMRERSLSEAMAKAQLAALQSQINPHFFFNTLNTLSALIPGNPEAAQEIVCRLADMFRYTLACSRAESVTLDQELAFTANYLKLEQARFSNRLRVSLPEGAFPDIQLPGLSLQPLVENAIRYGVAKLIEGGDVEVAVHRNGTQCTVDVLSPIEGPVDPSRFFRDGHALANIRERLKLYAGESARVDVAQEPHQVRVSLVLPR